MKKPAASWNFALGAVGADLICDPSTGNGSFESRHDRTARPTVIIGIAGTWEETFKVLMHEAMEATIALRNLRYRLESFDRADGSMGTIMLMTHEQFTSVVDEASHFALHALPRVQASWKELHKRGKKRA